MIDVDYTAKNRIGTLTIATDDVDVAGNLRDVLFQMQTALADGRSCRLVVEVV